MSRQADDMHPRIRATAAPTDRAGHTTPAYYIKMKVKILIGALLGDRDATTRPFDLS